MSRGTFALIVPLMALTMGLAAAPSAHAEVAIGLPGFGLYVGRPPAVVESYPPPVVYEEGPPVVYAPPVYARPIYRSYHYHYSRPFWSWRGDWHKPWKHHRHHKHHRHGHHDD